MKKILMFLFIVNCCYSQEINKLIDIYNNNNDKFKNNEIINIDKKIVKKINRDGYSIFYDKNKNIVKIEERAESETGDRLTYLRQYYAENSLIYFEYLVDVLSDSELNFVAKCYLNKNRIMEYKIYENEKMKKWKQDKIKEAFRYPVEPFNEYMK